MSRSSWLCQVAFDPWHLQRISELLCASGITMHLWNASCQQRNIFASNQNISTFIWNQNWSLKTVLKTSKFHVSNFNFCAVLPSGKMSVDLTWFFFGHSWKKMRLHSAGLSFSWPQHLTSVKVVGRVSKEDLVVRKERKKSTWPQFSKVMGLR